MRGDSKTINLVIARAMERAIAGHCKRVELTRSDWLRVLIARELGQPELADAIKMGRPVAEPEQPPPPRKRAKRG